MHLLKLILLYIHYTSVHLTWAGVVELWLHMTCGMRACMCTYTWSETQKAKHRQQSLRGGRLFTTSVMKPQFYPRGTSPLAGPLLTSHLHLPIHPPSPWLNSSTAPPPQQRTPDFALTVPSAGVSPFHLHSAAQWLCLLPSTSTTTSPTSWERSHLLREASHEAHYIHLPLWFLSW